MQLKSEKQGEKLLNRLPEGGQDLSFIRKGDIISIPVPTGESGFGPPLIPELVL